MKTKKSKSADLSKNRSSFLLLGGVIAISVTLMAFEWSSFNGILESNTEGTDLTNPIPSDEKIFDIKKPTPVQPKKIIAPRRDEVKTKTVIEIETKVEFQELDSIIFTNIDITGEEDEDVIVIEDIPLDTSPSDPSDPNVKIPFYDVCANATYDEKLNCISGKIHATLMEGLDGVSSDQIARNKSDRMYVRFVISKEGTITDVDIHNESDFHKGIVQKVKSTIVNVPVMHPATKYGKKVAINFSIPIRFSSN